MEYIPLTQGRLNPHLHWIQDEQTPYVVLPADPVLFSHHTFLFAITASSSKKRVLKMHFRCGSRLVADSGLVRYKHHSPPP